MLTQAKHPTPNIIFVHKPVGWNRLNIQLYHYNSSSEPKFLLLPWPYSMGTDRLLDKYTLFMLFDAAAC